MNFKPIYDRILVKVLETDEETTESGLVFNNPDKELIKGKVVLAGLGKHNKQGVFIENPIRVGDEILFYKSKGEPFNIEGEDYLGMNGIVDVEAVLN